MSDTESENEGVIYEGGHLTRSTPCDFSSDEGTRGIAWIIRGLWSEPPETRPLFRQIREIYENGNSCNISNDRIDEFNAIVTRLWRIRYQTPGIEINEEDLQEAIDTALDELDGEARYESIEHVWHDAVFDIIENDLRSRLSRDQMNYIIEFMDRLNTVQTAGERVNIDYVSHRPCAGIPYLTILKTAEDWLEENKPKPSILTDSVILSACSTLVQELADAHNCDLTDEEKNRFLEILKGAFTDYIEAANEVSESSDTFRDKACHHTENLNGQKFPHDIAGVVTFLHEGQSKAECISHSDWHNILASAPAIGIWQPVYPMYAFGYAPVFKLPYSGVFIQASQEHLDTFTCYQLELIGIKPIGSEYAMSALHGAEEKLYFAKPIHVADMRAFITSGTVIPSRKWLEGPFSPSVEDLTPAYVGHAEKIFIFTFNGQYLIEDRKTGQIIYVATNERKF